MRRIASVFALLLVLGMSAFAAPSRAAEADPMTAREVRETLEDIVVAYMTQDEETLLSLLAPDAGLVVIGPTRVAMGHESVVHTVRKGFERQNLLSFALYETPVGERNGVAWFAADCLVRSMDGDRKVAAPARWTGVLLLENGKWLLTQSHFSFSEEVYSIRFEAIDANGDGVIDKKELQAIYPATCNALLRRCDVDGSGGIDPDEWQGLDSEE